MSKFTVATANTFFGKASQDIKGLKNILDADILLLQEVIRPEKENLRLQLEESGYVLVAATEKFGLAIAVRADSKLKPIKDSLRLYSFHKLSPFEKLLVKRITGSDHEFAARGMATIKFTVPGGASVTMVDVHPGISFASKRSRNKQIRLMNQELKNTYYDGPIIIGGDMNHYPKPHPVDLELIKNHHLSTVDLAGRATWITAGSSYEKFARAAGVINRKPLEAYDGHLDAILYRAPGLQVIRSDVIEINSDHRAIIATFAAML